MKNIKKMSLEEKAKAFKDLIWPLSCEDAGTLFNCDQSAVYNWREEKRPVPYIILKFCTRQNIGEFIQKSPKIIKKIFKAGLKKVIKEFDLKEVCE